MPSPRLRSRNGQLSLAVDPLGSGPHEDGIYVTDNEPQRATFGYFATGIVPAANPTDLLVLRGSATKVVRLKSLLIMGTATAASNIICNLIRRSAANTGGTASNPAGIPRDTNNDAVSAQLSLYSANPAALGTAVGNVDGGRLNLAPAANGSIDRLMFQYAWQMDQALVLRGVSEFLALNLGGVAWPAGGALDISMMWTEE